MTRTNPVPKTLNRKERIKQIREQIDNSEVVCADCGTTVRRKDASHARTAPGTPSWVCNTCVDRYIA